MIATVGLFFSLTALKLLLGEESPDFVFQLFAIENNLILGKSLR